MRIRITTNKSSGHTVIPRQMIQAGFKGQMDTIVGPLTLVIVKPGTSPEETVRGLELIIENIRLEQQARQRQGEPPADPE